MLGMLKISIELTILAHNVIVTVNSNYVAVPLLESQSSISWGCRQGGGQPCDQLKKLASGSLFAGQRIYMKDIIWDIGLVWSSKQQVVNISGW